MHTIRENIKAQVEIIPQNLGAGAENGAGIDLLDYADAMAILNTGAVDGTDPTLDVKVQDSADNSTFADVTGLTFDQITEADQFATLRIDPKAVRRYVRLVATVGGTDTPTVYTSATILLGLPAKAPVVNS